LEVSDKHHVVLKIVSICRLVAVGRKRSESRQVHVGSQGALRYAMPCHIEKLKRISIGADSLPRVRPCEVELLDIEVVWQLKAYVCRYHSNAFN